MLRRVVDLEQRIAMFDLVKAAQLSAPALTTEDLEEAGGKASRDTERQAFMKMGPLVVSGLKEAVDVDLAIKSD